jgi:phospholipase/carboxylesterase
LGVGRSLAPDAALLSPRGKVVEGDGIPRFFRRIPTGAASAYPFTFDEREVLERTDELAAFVTAAQARHRLDGRPVVAVGFSNGANIALATMLLRPDALREVIAFAGMSPVPEPPAGDLGGGRVLLSNGETDPMAPIGSVDTVAGLLRERGVDVTEHRHAGGHQITVDGLARAKTWLATS